MKIKAIFFYNSIKAIFLLLFYWEVNWFFSRMCDGSQERTHRRINLKQPNAQVRWGIPVQSHQRSLATACGLSFVDHRQARSENLVAGGGTQTEGKKAEIQLCSAKSYCYIYKPVLQAARRPFPMQLHQLSKSTSSAKPSLPWTFRYPLPSLDL